jgi:hypothetical protein
MSEPQRRIAKRDALSRALEKLQVGQPLPHMGTCRHYRHSHRRAAVNPSSNLLRSVALNGSDSQYMCTLCCRCLQLAAAVTLWPALRRAHACVSERCFVDPCHCVEAPARSGRAMAVCALSARLCSADGFAFRAVACVSPATCAMRSSQTATRWCGPSAWCVAIARWSSRSPAHALVAARSWLPLPASQKGVGRGSGRAAVAAATLPNSTLVTGTSTATRPRRSPGERLSRQPHRSSLAASVPCKPKRQVQTGKWQVWTESAFRCSHAIGSRALPSLLGCR